MCRAKGPALVADVVRQLDERIHALYDSSEPGKKKGSVSLKPVRGRIGGI